MSKRKQRVFKKDVPDLGITFTITGPEDREPGGDSRGFDDFHTKIVGVTFKNRDGRNRQDVIRDLRIGQELFLHRDHSNKHDAEAIAVITRDRIRVGYIRAELADRLAPEIDAGARFSVVVASLTGGAEESLGVNIRIQSIDASAPRAGVRRKSGTGLGCGWVIFAIVLLAAVAYWGGREQHLW